MSEREHSPRPMGFVSAISDTNVKDDEASEQREKHKVHDPLHNVAHYLRNAVTLEPKHDEERRESAITEHEHRNDHGGKEAERHFWESHRKHSGKAACQQQHDHGTDCEQPLQPHNGATPNAPQAKEHADKKAEHHFWQMHHKQHNSRESAHPEPERHHDGATDDAVGHVMASNDQKLKTGGPAMGTLL
ncbi:hypothetical protein BKA63DRAFT_237419 [Paraphoma chrysanthemicola]|nr:hypothetical protein BKA63DRAFT_237419 [Paraphoma chrysanthemicola]